jgi:hypothetical protein
VSTPLTAPCTASGQNSDGYMCITGTAHTNNNSPAASSSSNAGAIAGGVIAALVVLAVAGGVIWWKKHVKQATPLMAVAPVVNPMQDKSLSV